MKKDTRNYLLALLLGLTLAGCSIDRKPESILTDESFWNTQTDLMNAANRLYQQLAPNWNDTRSDESVAININTISNGTREVPATSTDWSDRYKEIFTANNILQKGQRANVSDEIRNRYFGEARFFRAYAYLSLLQKYGDVPLLLKTLGYNSPELFMPRTPRAGVIKQIYEDLDFAATWLPAAATLPSAEYGRVTKSAAWALKARAALYEGTRLKFRGQEGWQDHLQAAVDAAAKVMGQGHGLYASYENLFKEVADGPANKENIFVKVYGESAANPILTHSNSRALANGANAITRNMIRMYLYTDGLPAFNTDDAPAANRSAYFVPEGNETSYNTVLQNRDPRLTATVFAMGENSYGRPWIPSISIGGRTSYGVKKGYTNADDLSQRATVDRLLIRYAEVLLIYAEAKYELAGAISDEDLNNTINLLRTRAGMPVKLSNAFVAANNLSMREEIRRERAVELALEGFRYDDLIRWKTAETVLPKELLGGKFFAAEWAGTNPNTLDLNADKILVVEPASSRTFRPDRDYLYPVPLNEIALSKNNVIQNPNWK
ncbi:RagB/SusD family nutrient uptake outer membrane protein [Niabella hirudinis]|uniref:RagB/SusD family nutrient uptake outer membrane protein n=1 Tax=Niabella hirudinis TaxID=1285929 RepID=UPI003EB814D0